jgi:hypothetical protein
MTLPVPSFADLCAWSVQVTSNWKKQGRHPGVYLRKASPCMGYADGCISL